VRTDGSGNPLKVFVVGVNASGSNNGEFIINDNGTQLSGALNRRMTIANDGAVTFTGNVTAHAYYSSSSLILKDNVRTYENALDTVNRLRGVSFDWKDSGKPSVGLIAEEVAKVVPEVVAYNDGAATGVNYASLVGVLVEAVKEQEVKHQAEVDSLKMEVDSLKSEMQQLKALLQER
jgi:polyhydroxyalkanoate synthesis regulator phasin